MGESNISSLLSFQESMDWSLLSEDHKLKIHELYNIFTYFLMLVAHLTKIESTTHS